MGSRSERDSYGYSNESPAIAVVDRVEWWIGICNSCQGAVLVRSRGERIYPAPQPSPSDPLIPDHLRRDLDEAKMCASVSCYQAAAVMARRSIQLACIEKGCDPKKRLVDQIVELTNQGHITKDIEEWATVVRFVGNDGAHPSKDLVSEDEAVDCLKLAEQFLHVLFVTPSLAKQRLAARKAAKTKP